MNWFIKLRMTYKILLPVSVTLVLVLSVLAWQIQSKGSEIVQAVAERELKALAGQYSGDVRSFIQLALTESGAIADAIAALEGTDSPLSRQQISEMLTPFLSDTIGTLGVMYLPTPEDTYYIDTPGTGADGQFNLVRSAKGVRVQSGEFFKDKLFTEPQRTGTSYMTAPYFYTQEGVEVLLTSVAAPIMVKNVFQGIAFVDISLAQLGVIANEIQIYETGVASIFLQDGTILAHTNPDRILAKLFDLPDWKNNTQAKAAFKAGEPFMGSASFSGVESFFYYSPIVFPQIGQTLYFALIVPVDEVLADVAQLTNVTLMASAFALITLLIVIFIGVRASIKPLAQIVAAAEEVTRGNFAIKLDSKDFGGEILDLKLALEAMLGSLVENIGKAEAMSKDAQEQTLKAKEAMREAEAARVAAEGAKREGMLAAAGQLENVVEVISAASQELATQVEHSEHSSIEQASRMAETATAMEEMNSTVLEVARNASAASDISAQTRSQAESGSRIVQDAVTGIQRVQTVSLALKEDMSTLASQAKSISEIMNVISDIADQTNLLALNAAIEAARAGDAGRGFAVVADEVRKLAEKTMASTTDVGNAIQSIQASVSASIRQVDQAVELIGEATEQSNQSGGALNEIVILVDNTADQVRAIATASEEQSATSEEINRAIAEINEISEQGVQSMREAASAVNDLAVQAQALSSLIDEMKQA